MKRILVLVSLLAAAPPALAQVPVCIADTAGGCNRVAVDASNSLRVAFDHPNKFTCGVTNQAATLLECQALAAGRTYYITDIVAQSSTATAGTFAVQSGTGANCGTSTATVFPAPPMTTAARFASPPNTQPPITYSPTTPLVVTQGQAICAIGVLTNTLNIQISGYYTP